MLSLFWAFLKIGAVMMGGGYAMLPLLVRELVDKRDWITKDELLDIFAVAQCTPGVIAVNSASFIGYKRHKAWGAVVATLGIITVPFLMILGLATLMRMAQDIPLMFQVFAGMRVAVCALIIDTVIKLTAENLRDWLSILLCAISFLLVATLNINPVFIVLGAALLGFVLWGRERKGRVSK